ncbi:hypothetical protein [Roseovarius rhodophyticola]|uniref:Uncharacterized protein n=1 Tax=Roseovarius rhodophyticola TaxID=3080827 RepID=A0ABZ2TDG3_9RHOB|nr:hypothetical protein [Roseovarius sp. W115]MDV2931016.1 hypothetical protein [Roseovarius sp. W115]
MAISVIRAPAVLGPGDSATYPLFSNLAKGILVAPGSARNFCFSIIDVADLSKLLVALAKVTTPVSERIAPYGHARLDWPSIAQSAQRTLNRPIRTLYIPPWLMKIAAHAVDFFARLSGKAQVISADKLGEVNAGDWIAEHPVENPVPLDETMRRCLAPFGNLNAKDA